MKIIKSFIQVIILILFSVIHAEDCFSQACLTNCTPLNETFGSVATASCVGVAQNFTNAAIVNHTAIAYSPGGAANDPNDGGYSIRCDGDENNAGWHGGGGSTIGDHTVDATGQVGLFAVINSGAGPREFFHKNVSDLCVNTTYNLTFYAANVVKRNGASTCNYGMLPSLQAYTFPSGTPVQTEGSKSTASFSATGGTLIGSTGDLACTYPSNHATTPQGLIWNAYSYNFTTGGAQTSIDIVLTSLRGDNAGGDFVIDDIRVTWVSGGGVSCTAPVDLISFTAERTPQNVILNWSTANEVNFSHYIIERSTDGVNFEQIGVMNRAANGLAKNDYTYIDNSTNQGIVYYRLKQVDLDGTYKYSAVSHVKFDATSPALLYSVDGDIVIQFTTDVAARYSVVDMLGNTLISNNRLSDESIATINKEHFKSGVYIVKVQVGNELVTQKFIMN